MLKTKLFAVLLCLMTACIPNEKPAPPIHESDWAVYSTLLDDRPAVISVDLGLRAFEARADFPELIRISLAAHQIDENGFPTESELSQIIALEETLEPALDSRGAIMLGRITSSGYRHLFVQTSDGEMVEKTARERLPQASFKISRTPDPDWSYYVDNLYPNKWEMNQIQNGRVLEQLQAAGDDLRQPRRIDHWLYFQDETGRDSMIALVTADGFEIAETGRSPEEGDYPLLLHINRLDSIGYQQIDDLTFRLETQADQLNGTYDGWETEVVRQD